MKAWFGIARFLLGGMLLAAAGLKAMHPHGSAIAIGTFQLTPPWLSLIGGIVLPGVEAVVGAALWTGRHLRGAGLASVGLALLFALGVISAMERRLDLECGCFGHLAITPRAGFGTLAFDAALLLLAMIVFVGAGKQAQQA